MKWYLTEVGEEKGLSSQTELLQSLRLNFMELFGTSSRKNGFWDKMEALD